MRNSSAILLVGGSGFVGRHLAIALKKSFSRYACFMLSNRRASLPEGWQHIYGDLLNPPSIDDAIRELRPQIIIHLAAQASIDVANIASEMTWRVNFGGTFELASAAARHAPAGTFFFTSSAEVYGQSFLVGPANEETALLPNNSYAASKMAAEYALRQVLPPDTRLIIARAFNHTGPGQDERFAIPSFAAQIARIESGLQEPVINVGDLAFERDFLHVSDVVDAYIRLLKLNSEDTRILVNVCSGRGYRIRDLLDELRRYATVPVKIVADPTRMRPGGIQATIGDPTRLRAMTGWQPQRSMSELLRELLDSWRAKTETK